MKLYQFLIIKSFFSLISIIYSSPMDAPWASGDAPSKIMEHKALMDEPYVRGQHVDQSINSNSEYVHQDGKRVMTIMDAASHKKQKATMTENLESQDFLEYRNLFPHGQIKESGPVQEFNFFPIRTEHSSGSQFQDHTSDTLHHPKIHNEDTMILELFPEHHSDKICSNNNELLSKGLLHKPSSGSSEVKISSSILDPSDTRMGIEGGHVPPSVQESTDHNSSLGEMTEESDPSPCLRKVICTLPLIGISFIQSHILLSQIIIPWFQELNKNIAAKPNFPMPIEVHAHSKLTTSFLACLKFAYQRESTDLAKIYESGWNFLSQILEQWKYLDLKKVINTRLKSANKRSQKVDATFLLAYALNSPNVPSSGIPMTSLWKLCANWDKIYSKDNHILPLTLGFSEFSQRIISGVKETESWKSLDLEEAVRMPRTQISKFPNDPRPSILLRHLLIYPPWRYKLASYHVVWGLWVAWMEWDGCIVRNKQYIPTAQTFLQKLIKESESSTQHQ
ncbi:hypothetical protein DFH28DRAFT_1095977 [Melampsora americana]|nr:hypothetical protein DFH28DRAFT_1095977 [Melampsora americana]